MDVKSYAVRRDTLLFAMIFVLGFQTMVLELSLPRLLAPVFGNTLFCWTAAISEVLAALAIGYHIGGVFSTRKSVTDKKILWRLSAISALCVVFTGIMGDKIVGSFHNLGMIFGPLASTLLLAVPAVTASAAILPISVAVLSSQSSSGKITGRLYAFSTIGSVMGVLMTGYFLLPGMGISGSLFFSSSLVFLLLILAKRFISAFIGMVLISFFVFIPFNRHATGELIDWSNGYHRIKIIQNQGNESIRLLYLDSSLEGAVMLGNDNPGLSYQREGIKIVLKIPTLKRCFFLGGGSFSMPRFIKKKKPNVVVDVAEIDQDVLDASIQYLELDSDINIRIGDGRRVLSDTMQKYDLIINDAFHGLRHIPFHLLTKEFNQIVSNRLTDNGIYLVNIMGSNLKSRLISSVIRTLEEGFAHVHFVNTQVKDVNNFWLLASKSLIDIGKPVESEHEASIVFTDDHAPVEYFIASDFAKK